MHWEEVHKKFVPTEFFSRDEASGKLVNDFKQDEKLEAIVREYAELFNTKGALNQVKEGGVPERPERMKEIEGAYGEQMRVYLEPYAGKLRQKPGSGEWHRWCAAVALDMRGAHEEKRGE